jgi:predicted TIM-barrel fold metal-dependent hydrolase
MTDRTRPARRFDSLLHVSRTGAWPNGRDDAGVERLLAELDRGGVARGCLVGLPGVVDNDYVLECAAASRGRLVPVAGVHPPDMPPSQMDEEIRGLASAGFRGIKLHPRLGRYDPLDSRALDIMRAAADHGLVVFLDTLFRQRDRPTAPAADTIDRIAATCPGVTMVLLHGGGTQLLDVAQVVRLYANLLLDLSYTLLAFTGSSVDMDLTWVLKHLDRRVVIGSDMPEFTPAETFNRVDELMYGLPDVKHANVTYENLAMLFGPELSPVAS